MKKTSLLLLFKKILKSFSKFCKDLKFLGFSKIFLDLCIFSKIVFESTNYITILENPRKFKKLQNFVELFWKFRKLLKFSEKISMK